MSEVGVTVAAFPIRSDGRTGDAVLEDYFTGKDAERLGAALIEAALWNETLEVSITTLVENNPDRLKP